GTGGITAANATSADDAEISTTGNTTLISDGAIGSGTHRIQFAANMSNIDITTTDDAVFLNGLGNLTLDVIDLDNGTGASLDVSQASGFTLTSGGVVTLGAAGGFSFEADEIDITAAISGGGAA